jgi:hypothetical protein
MQRLFCPGKGLSAKAPEHTIAKVNKRGIGFAEQIRLVVPLARRTDHDVLRIAIAAHIASLSKID